MSAYTFTRGHSLYRTRWCDPFEVNTSDGHGWMLLDLPGAPCDVTQPGMRTMSQRLRKAEQCAAAGGKYGLLQAVLLSLDSQPITPAQWVREAVALEACSRVLLPEAHEVPLDLAAAQAAYDLLTTAEQRLWKQLQAARTQVFYSHLKNLDMMLNLEGFQPSDMYTASVLGGIAGDASFFAHEMMRCVVWPRRWDVAVTIPKHYGLLDDPAAPVSMQIAYNWALASYHHYGQNHSETKAALAATEAADPQAWVPKLMAGLAYPSVSMAPAYVAGGFLEAEGYAAHFGQLWAVASSSGQEQTCSTPEQAFTSYGAGLKWLLSKRGIAIPTQQQQREVSALRLLTCGYPFAALHCQVGTITEVVDVCDGNHWLAYQRELEQRGVARLLRCLVVEVCGWAAVTMNLPPWTAAPRLWESLGVKMGLEGLERVALGLEGVSSWAWGTAVGMIEYYRHTLEGRPAAAAALGFWNPQELHYLESMQPALTVTACRWLWQRGQASLAQQMCQVKDGWPLGMLHNAAVNAPPAWLQHMADGVVPPSTQSIDALVAFAAQEKARMLAVRPDLLVKAQQASASRGAAAGRAIITKQGDPQEQRLYGLFPGWLDQLVSQVTGRQVTLVVEPAAAHDMSEVGEWPRCSVYIKDAASGQQQLFHWKHPGDADCQAAHQVLKQHAVSSGSKDWEEWTGAALVPYDRAPGAGGSSSSSSSTREPRQQDRTVPRSPAARAAGAAAGRSADRSSGITTDAGGPSSAPHTVTAGRTEEPAQQPNPSASAAAVGGGSGGSGAANSPAEVGQSAASSSAEPAGVHTGLGDGAGSSRVKPSRPCAACGELFPKLKQCSRCKAVAYCSRDCQLAHWKAGHKESCQERPVA